MKTIRKITPGIRTLAACLLCLGAGAAASAIAGSSSGSHPSTSYKAADGTKISGIKVTGAGLPDLGGTSTYGINELAQAASSYHDSGTYDKDLARVGKRAKTSLRKQLGRLHRNRGRGRYTRCHHGKCKKVKPVIVLDIDETSLSNYQGLKASNFSQAGLVSGAVSGNDPVIAPTLKLYDFARRKHVKVAFITGRPDLVSGPTNSNLRSAGYDKGYSLTLKPSGPTTIAYKSGARKALTKKGFTILVNVGDQDSDLQGGFAKRAFKYPNPFYFIP